MKAFATFALIVAIAGFSSLAGAAELQSGLAVGDSVPAFYVVKAAGADSDGVSTGDELCYRCRYGNRPVVMVFTRGVDKEMGKMIKKIDDLVAQNESKQMRAFVNLLGDNRDDLEATAKQLAAHAELANVPVVVPVDHQNGPANLNLNQDADVTVTIYSGSQVKASHALKAGELDAETAKAILADTAKILN